MIDHHPRRKPDGFYRTVADQYAAAMGAGKTNPANSVALTHEVPVTTVHGWIKEARRRGLLPDGERSPAHHRISDVAGRRLTQLRRSANMTRRQVAEAIAGRGHDISEYVLTNLETGRRSWSLDAAVAVAEHFGITVEALAAPLTCDSCLGAPPAGFTCNSCGSRQESPNTPPGA